jgi:hypothetical protein
MEKNPMNLALLQTPAPATIFHPGAALPVVRYRFTFRMYAELRLPEFAGSLLRGQFGASLKRIACMTGMRECPPCPLYRTCPYPAIFETPPPESHALQRFSQVPNPYVIEPPPLGQQRVAAGETIAFHLVLVGRALPQLPLIAYAFQRAFERGIGKQRSTAELEDLAIEQPDGPQSIWGQERSRIKAHKQVLTLQRLPQVSAITLRITTPLRLQYQGHPISPDRLRPRTLFTALVRRASLLFELHAGMPPVGVEAGRLAAAAERLSDEHHLQWRDWKRFSSRQQQEMTLGGVVGEWKLAGELDDLLPWLWLGQWLHVGKNASMGMGRYSLSL